MKGGFSRKNKKGLGRAFSSGLLSQLLGETGNTISNADRARLQAMARQDSGKSISDADRERIEHFLGRIESPRPKTDRQLMQFEDGGKVKKPKTLPKPKPKIGDRNEMGPIYTDTKTGKKVKRLNKGGGLNAAIDRVKKTQGMKKGGAAVPSEFKGFSKLPEAVQVKMDPVAAKKYNGGGEVRGMGRAYMGASRKAKIR